VFDVAVTRCRISDSRISNSSTFTISIITSRPTPLGPAPLK
jgi:hypothetical protein